MVDTSELYTRFDGLAQTLLRTKAKEGERPAQQSWVPEGMRGVADDATIAEARRVLIRVFNAAGLKPSWALDAAEGYARECEYHVTHVVRTDTPKCRDPEDQMFVDLAFTSGAMVIAASDKAPLELDGRNGLRVAPMATLIAEHLEQARTWKRRFAQDPVRLQG